MRCVLLRRSLCLYVSSGKWSVHHDLLRGGREGGRELIVTGAPPHLPHFKWLLLQSH